MGLNMEALPLLGLGVGLLVLLVVYVRLKQRAAASVSETAATRRTVRRLRDGPHPQLTAVMEVGCGDDGRCWFDIVGEASYQGTLRLVAGNRLENEEEVFVDCEVAPEPDNPHDSKALAVYIAAVGKVGYFSREDLAGEYGTLRDRLAQASAVGRCRGKLTGGWDEDAYIGVRLALMRPAEVRGEPVISAGLGGLNAPDGWFLRHRVDLPAGKAWLSLVDEYDCQAELRRLAEDRDVARETVAFTAVLVPPEGGVLVCADGGSPVGRLGRGDVVSSTGEDCAARGSHVAVRTI
jgi:hypothetical protein